MGAAIQIRNIQGLRFLAAFAVAAFHVGAHYFYLDRPGWLAPLLLPFKDLGTVGVDVFFVISGFIMWHTTRDAHAPVDAPAFLIRRFARIFVGYWPWLAFGCVVYFLLLGNSPEPYNILGSITLAGNAVGTGRPVLSVTWTLTFELVFYLALALTMLLPRGWAVPALACWALAGLLSPWPATALLSPYVVEFVAGAALCWYLSGDRPAPLWAFAAVALGALVAGVLLAEGSIHLRVLLFGCFATALVGLAVLLEGRGWIVPRWVVTLGGASYALYLCHMPIITYARSHWRAVLAQPDLMFATALGGSIAIAVLWYVVAEERLNGRVRHLVAGLLQRPAAARRQSAST